MKNNKPITNDSDFFILNHQMPSEKEIAKYKYRGHKLQSEAFSLCYKRLKTILKNTPSFLRHFWSKSPKTKKKGYFDQK